MPFRVLVATDGSLVADAAVSTAASFPWPHDATAHVVVARRPQSVLGLDRAARAALDHNASAVAESARRALSRRWHDATATVADRPPVAAILAEARRLRASTIVVGWRGHGTFRRLLLGSVSRGVVRGASCPVLVTRVQPHDLRSFVLGIDGSANARRAARFLGSLEPSRGGRVTVVRVEEPMTMPPSAGRLPGGARGMLHKQLSTLNTQRLARAQRDVDGVAAMLAARGFKVRKRAVFGAPLDELFATVAATRAGTLVVGARGTGGAARLLLGSVADGALNGSPVPVLVVR